MKPEAKGDQATYDGVMKVAETMLYGDDTTHQAVVQKLRSQAKNMSFAVGHTAAMILKSSAATVGESKVTDTILLEAGQEIVAELCDIAAAAKLAQPNDEKLFRDACFQAVKVYGEGMLQSGKVTPAMQAQARQAMQQGVAREKMKGGAIGKAMP